jgi:hypothetical protein
MGALKVCWAHLVAAEYVDPGKVLPQFVGVGFKPTEPSGRQSKGLPGTKQVALAPLVKIHLQPFSAPHPILPRIATQ